MGGVGAADWVLWSLLLLFFLPSHVTNFGLFDQPPLLIVCVFFFHLPKILRKMGLGRTRVVGWLAGLD